MAIEAVTAVMAEVAKEATKEVAVETAKALGEKAVVESGKGGIESLAGTNIGEATEGFGREIRILNPNEGLDLKPWEQLSLNQLTKIKVPDLGTLIESKKSPYNHMRKTLKIFFNSKNIEIKIDPNGMPRDCRPDIFGVDKEGNLVVGEIKTAKEAGESVGSWESWWRDRGLFENYSAAVEKLSSEVKGWCGVIDGQLREYCEKLGVNNGFLAVEKGEQFAKDIEKTLNFLKEEGRIKGFERVGADTKGNTVWKIVYN